MERKNFKCYACHQSNNFYVQTNRIGNCCKFCGTYNYFKIKKNKFNSHSFKNENNQSSENIKISDNICLNILDENSPLLSCNIPINNNINSNDININFLFEYDSSNNIQNYDCNNVFVIKDEVVKYDWLKKIKATKDIIDKCGKDFVCSICYEGLKLRDDIHISKCKHIFHYNCIEKAIDNNFKECPLCRSNIQTGEQKHINKEIRNVYFEEMENNEENFPLNNNNIFIDDNYNHNSSRNQFFNLLNNIKNCFRFFSILFYWPLKLLVLICYYIFNSSLISKIKEFSGLKYIILCIILLVIIIAYLILHL